MPLPADYLPQVILKFDDSVQLPYQDDIGAEIDRLYGPWTQLEQQFPGIRIRRLYQQIAPDDIRALVDFAATADASYTRRNLLTYFVVVCPTGADVEEVARQLTSWASVESAEIDSTPSLPGCTVGYGAPAPMGIDAAYAQHIPGGDGRCQVAVDIEVGWTLTHDALVSHAIGGPIIGVNNTTYCEHGTNTLGVICGRDPGKFAGIVPNLTAVAVASAINAAGEFSIATIAEAILFTALVLKHEPGSVMVIELQTSAGEPVERYQACWDNVRLACACWVVVIEAAGNRGVNLDVYPALNRNSPATFKDSLAIVVAACTSTYPHVMGTSNYGSRIDSYAWGDSVLTADSTSPADIHSYGCYNNTSSSTAIIGGAALSVQGMALAHSGHRLTPSQMRTVLGNPVFGTPAAGPNGALLGSMPNLKTIGGHVLSGQLRGQIPAGAFGTACLLGDLVEGRNPFPGLIPGRRTHPS